MRRENTQPNSLATWLSRSSWGCLGLMLCLLAFQVTAGAQSTFVGNNFVIPTGAPGTTTGPASGTVAVSCVGVVPNGANITLNLNLVHTFVGDLAIWLVAPNGDVLELSTRNGGGNNNMNVTFSDPPAGVTFINAAVATTSTTTLPCGGANTFAYNGTFRPEGRNAVIPAFPTSPSDVPAAGTFTFATQFSGDNADGTWTLIINDHVGGDVGATCNWSLTFAGVVAPTCTFVGAPVLPPITNLGLDLGVCTSLPIPIPATTGSCVTIARTFQVGTGPITAIPGAAVTIDPNLGPGTYTITFRVTNQCNQTTTATQVVTVVDLEDPVFTACPADIIVNLDPGACDQIINFDVTVSDNCGGETQNVGQPGYAFPAVGAGGFTVAGGNLPGGYMFDLQNITSQPIRITSFQVRFADPPNLGPAIGSIVPVDVYATTVAPTYAGNSLNAGAWTQIGDDIPVTVVGTGVQNVVTLPGAGISLAPGQSRGIFVYGPVNSLVYNNLANSTLVPQNINGQLILTSGVSQGVPIFGAAQQFGPPRSPQVIISYVLGAPTTLVQTEGLPSGSVFPIGITTNCFLATDPSGNTSECCFDIEVLEFPNPVSSLTCNDLVQISLDEDCSHVIGADDILEGGPYGCYDDYIVELDRTAPFGNGPWTPAILGPGDIGRTYQVRVTDPVTGNRCWGLIHVEDKLPPVLVCPSDTVACNADITPGAVNPFLPITVAPGNTILDNQTRITNIPVSGASGLITDLNLALEITHTWTGDLDADLVSPSGTVVDLFTFNDGPLFCTQDNLNLLFDDEAADDYATLDGTCNASTTGLNNPGPPYTAEGTFNAQGLLSAFDGEDPNGIWQLRIRDNVGGDQGRVESVSLIFSGIVSPVVLPNELVFPGFCMQQISQYCFVVPFGCGVPILDNCSDVTLCYIDQTIPQACPTGFSQLVNRKWTATDESGNSSTCVQTFSFLLPTLDDVVCPPDYDGIDAPMFDCLLLEGVYPTPDVIESLGLQGYPYVFGLPDGCTINFEYVDILIEVCDGTYKISRTWTIIDWCVGEQTTCTQIIKVVDNEGPSIVCPANLTVTTDPFQCCAIINLPDVIVSDNCSRINNVSGMIIALDFFTNDTIGMFPIGGFLSDFPGNNHWDRDTLANFGLTPCLPLGNHTVVLQVEDDCGNTSTCTFRLAVRDFTPPVAVCDEFTVVGIGVDDPYDCYLPGDSGCDFAGVTWVKATTFDDGSYDNCGDIYFTVRRMQPYSDCILGLNPINGHPDCDDIFPDFPSEFERAISEYDSIKFYCCEVGTSQMVILRVYQLDANGNISVGPDGSPIFNECMVEIEVQDKLKPVCISPPHVTVNCENFDPSLWPYGKATIFDNCCLDTTRVYQGQCGLTHTVNYNLFDTVCNRGTIVRTFRAFDCYGLSTQCTQRIVVTYEQDYFVRFPNDVIVTFCDSSGIYGQPTFFGEDCELLGVSFEDEIFEVVPDACFKIERTWHIINWCTYNPNLPLTYIPNPNPNPAVNHPSNLTGPTVSACGTPNPWAPTVIRINPTDPTPTNYCIFYDPNGNGYEYKQIIKIVDGQDPLIANCPASPVTFCDFTPNDPLLWNEMYWFDPVIGSHNLCEGPTDLCLTATDLCSGSNISIHYLLFLDLDGDGLMETVINSKNLPDANTVFFGNAGNPNFTGGTPRQFDERPVPFNQKWRFALQTTTNGVNKTACVRWNTIQSPNTYVVPELPYGTHKIKWIVDDGCGNESICEYTFIVKDCKKPTVVCFNGLSVNIMPTQMITLWAIDFLQYAEDNCTPADQLKIGIRKLGQGTGFPVDGAGNPITSVTFTCDELGLQQVEIWAIDAAGNADFCATYVLVQDNMGNCPDSLIHVAGQLQTEPLLGSQGVEEADVHLNGTAVGVPPFSLFDQSDNVGEFMFSNAIPIASNYTVTPVLDINPLNGVSTYDLVLISRHILNLEPLNSPYKMIAADANKSGSITTFDIVELRKLILGIYQELPNNTSWRFVDKAYAFPNPSNPFQTTFPENISVANMMNNDMDDDFVGVKVGDVNGTAVANSLVNNDDRSAGTLLFDVQDRAVTAGEEFTLSFKADQSVLGYQFTLNTAGLEVLETSLKSENYAVFAAEQAMTLSLDGVEAGAFTVTFRALKAGQVSELLGVSSRITKAEGYTAAGEKLDVAFRFNGTTIAGVGFELYQNEPNPFVSKTMIGFHLPEGAEATLSIYDETGRVIYQQTGEFSKGYNTIVLDRAMLNTVGMLYYKLEAAEHSATKKMIQTK